MGATLNAVGLSNKGLAFYLRTGRWQELPDPFMLSFMTVEESLEAQLEEARCFVALMKPRMSSFRSGFAIQDNEMCPNVGGGSHLDVAAVAAGAHRKLDIFAELRVPTVVKLNVTVPVEVAAEIARHPACDALCVSNTLKWGTWPDKISWGWLFLRRASPLAKYGGGGLSGKPLLPHLVNWVERARPLIDKPIIAGGGILHPHDVHRLAAVGADAISPGTITILRPWRLQDVIQTAHQLARRS